MISPETFFDGAPAVNAAVAAATGADYAEARASASGVVQFVSGSEADALIECAARRSLTLASLVCPLRLWL